MKDTQTRYRAFLSYNSDATPARWLRPPTEAHRIPKCRSRDGRHAARRRDDDSHASYRQSNAIFHGMHSLILFLLPPSAKEFPARQRAVFAELETAPMQSGTKI
ncbi:MAG: hypothetical protein ABIO86_04565 [Sphingomonas sp.]